MNLIGGILLVLIIIIVASATKDRTKQKNLKAITEVSIKLIFGIVLSIILSVIIALNADISPSAGHGGFIHIIGPGIIGLIILLFYLISLGFKPDLKYPIGLASIFLNVIVGTSYMVSSF